VRRWAVVPIGLLGASAALIAWAILHGGASLAVVVVVPVIFGSSVIFFAGVVLLLAGLFTVPLAFEPGVETEETPVASPPGPAPSSSGGGGGLVLIGPVPIFFGSWKHVSSRTRLWVAGVGAAILVVAAVAFWLAVR
jgi:uncharacterized protein (TIGR00304 family)